MPLQKSFSEQNDSFKVSEYTDTSASSFLLTSFFLTLTVLNVDSTTLAEIQ